MIHIHTHTHSPHVTCVHTSIIYKLFLLKPVIYGMEKLLLQFLQVKLSLNTQFKKPSSINSYLRIQFFSQISLSANTHCHFLSVSESRSVVSDSLRPHGLYVAPQAHLSMVQASILEEVAMPFSRGSSQPRVWTQVSHTAGRFFINWATREAFNTLNLVCQKYWFYHRKKHNKGLALGQRLERGKDPNLYLTPRKSGWEMGLVIWEHCTWSRKHQKTRPKITSVLASSRMNLESCWSQSLTPLTSVLRGLVDFTLVKSLESP